MRFRRAQRILRSTEFVRIMRDGKRLNHASFAIHYRFTDRGYARIGIAVGRRVAPRANRRNTIKRIVRECFRRDAPGMPSLDLVFNARAGAAASARSDLAAAISEAFARIRSLKPLV